jgi:tetratricopeptide (TPR) repeat protein
MSMRIMVASFAILVAALTVVLALIGDEPMTRPQISLVVLMGIVGGVSLYVDLKEVVRDVGEALGLIKRKEESPPAVAPAVAPAAVAQITGSTAGRDIYAVVGDLHIGSTLPPYEPPTPPPPDTLADPGPLPPGSRLPHARNALFTGREAELLHLARAYLHEEKGGVLVGQVAQGSGGWGKTQLAVEFAHRYGRYFSGVHWINAADPAGIAAEVVACGEAMALQPWPERQDERVAHALHAWRQGRRLVVLDNLEYLAAGRDWVGRLSGLGVCVLVTSRRTDWPADLGLSPLRVPLFTPEESREFLRRRERLDRFSDGELDALATRLGHLPLVLELAARYLEVHRALSLDTYLARLADIWEHPAMQGWQKELGNPTQHDLDLQATFAVSWEQVGDPAAQRMFHAAGYLAPNEPIPAELLAGAAGVEDEAADAALDALVSLSLLQRDDAASAPSIHPLLAEYSRALPGMAEMLPTLAQTIEWASNQALESGWPARYAPYRPHLEAVAVAAEGAGLERAGALWNSLGRVLRDLGDPVGVRAALEQALAIGERVYGPEHPTVAVRLNNLGLVLQDLGDLAGARAAYERALAIDERAHGPDHPEVAADINNLGGVLQELGDLAGARAALERALAIGERVYGPDHPTVAIRVNNLGSVLQDLGDLAGARAAFERALAIDEWVYGPDHPQVAIRVNNLGSVLQELGDVAGARTAFERALAIDERVYGPDHPQVATIVNNLGSVLQELGDLAGARAALERALAIGERVYGPDHPTVAIRVNNLGSVLQDLGDLAGARAAFERALAIDERVHGPDHPEVAIRVNNLGSVLREQGDLSGARAAFERALAIGERVHGPDHPNVAIRVNNLGGVLRALGDLPGARAAFERALAIGERVYGPDHPTVAACVNNLGSVLHGLGDVAGARVAFERALAILVARLPADHQYIVSLRAALAALPDDDASPEA